MTISSSNRKAGPFTGTGSLDTYSFTFKVFAASDLLVVRTDLSSVQTNLVLTTDYTVSLNANQDSNPGGSVTLVAGNLASGYLLTITSSIPALQAVDFTNQGGFYPNVLNTALDKLTILMQQAYEQLSRAFIVDISSSKTPDEFVSDLEAASNTAVTAAGSASTSATNAASSAATALAASQFVQAGTGAVTRTSQNKMRDIVSVKDFGAKGDDSNDDGPAIQAAIDAGYIAYLPPGIYRVLSEIVIKDGTGLIGASAFWKVRTGFIYDGSHTSVIKYVGAGGTNSCVIRASAVAVGTQGTDFTTGSTDSATDDLINIALRDFHIDSNNLAEIGCYVYRAGNQATISNITAEKAKKYNHVHLGCYSAQFGVFGAFESEQHGVAIGWDIFSWGTSEATCFAYTATFHTCNNGTNHTYVKASATDTDDSGGKFSAGRGSRVCIISENNYGRSCLLSQYNMAGAAGGTSEYYLQYLEGNGDGPYVDYRDAMDGLYLIGGFIHPGNGSTLLPQDITIEGKNNSGVVTANSGPTTSSEWLVLKNIMSELTGTGIAISSNTYKYAIKGCTNKNTLPATKPAVVNNSDNQANAGVYFTASSTPTIWKAINGTLTRSSTGTYLFTFTHGFKTSGAVVPLLSVVVDADTTYDTQVRLSSLSASSATIRVYNAAGTLTDTGDRLSLLLAGELA